MRTRLYSWRLQIIGHPVIASLVALFFILVTLVFLGGYLFHWDWTGINSQANKTTIISTPLGIFRATEVQSEKNLWDWLGLLGVLAIPVVVGLGAAWYTVQQGKVSDRENIDNQRETALQAYIDKLSELLLHEHLGDYKPEYEMARKVARVRTLTVLSLLDGKRKRSVRQFLHESGLIDKDTTILDLTGADLSYVDLSRTNWIDINLYRANLQEANLWISYLLNADLSGADLRGVDLNGATLMGTNLSYASLGKADLSGANMEGADLRGVDLSKVNLFNTDLSDADLKGVVGVTIEELEKQTKSLKGTTMPDGYIHS